MGQPLNQTVFPGQEIVLQCRTSDHVSWFHYHECDIRRNRIPLHHEKVMISDMQIDEIAVGQPDDITLNGANTNEITLIIPDHLPTGDTTHIITEITSKDAIPLKRYARTILTVTTIKEDHA